MAVAVMRNNHEEVNNFLKPKQFSNDEARVNDNLGLIPSDINQALKSIIELTAKFTKIANDNPDNPIAKVLEAAVNETNEKDPKLVRFVMMNFVPHAPTINSRVPSIVNRASGGGGLCTDESGATPGVSVSKKKGTSTTASGSVLSTAPPVQHETGDAEDWYRKDPNFNEHHEHWQMLARLYAEHLTMGIPLAKSLENYQDLILEKCKPRSNDNDNTPFGPNLKLDDLDKGWSVDNMESSLKAIEEAIKNGGKFPDGSEITSNLPGATIESSNVNKKDRKHSGPSRPSSQSSDLSHTNVIDNGDPKCSRTDNSPRKNVNNWKHNGSSRDSSQSSDLSRTDDDPAPEGYIELKSSDLSRTDNDPSMRPSRTNVIDSGPNNRPKCYHDHDLSRTGKDPHARPSYHNSHSKLQDTLQPNDFSDAPPVNIRKGDIILVPSRDSSQDPNVSQTTTFRVPEEFAQSRLHHWIEVDKFKQTLPSKSKTVVCRDRDMSSIIRQPPQKTSNDIVNQSVGESTTEKLPRERKGGMSIDEIPTLNRCSKSISFCDAETPTYKYPDNRPIGYPFDRPFKNNSYEETFKVHNATIKDITINWADNIPEIDVKA